MRLPELAELATAKDNTEVFTGYNHNLRNSVGEWYDQKNMTTDYYPVASPRDKRSVQGVIKETPIAVQLIEDEIEYYKANGCEGLAYTDKKLIALQKFYDGEECLGLWFTSNGRLVSLCDNSPLARKAHLTMFSRIEYRGYSHNVYLYYAIYEFSGDMSDFDAAVGDTVVFRYKQGVNAVYSGEISGQVIETTDNSIKLEIWLDEWGDRSPSEMNPSSLALYDCYVDFTNISMLNKIQEKLSYFNSDINKRYITRMGSYICVFPDGVVYETANKKDDIPVFSIAKRSESGSLTFQTVIPDEEAANGYKEIERLENSTDNEENYRLIDGQIQYYIPNTNMWVNQPTQLMICGHSGSRGMFDGFNVGDTLTFKYETDKVPGDTLEGVLYGLFDFDAQEGKFKEKSIKILKKGTITDYHGWDNDYIIVDGFAAQKIMGAGSPTLAYHTIVDPVSFTRKMPDMEAFTCESQNRIWCCSKDGHEIYASALGNPYNFYDYSGIATDSYAVNVGTDGVFTGCINYLGKPLFFKENCLHYISGSYPSNDGSIDGMSYAVTTVTDFKGVERGSEKSLAVIDNILYYKSAAGIVAYDGATTTVISDALGKEKYKNAVAGAYKNKYYVSMQDRKDVYHLFVFDTVLGSWCKEDNLEIQHFLKVENELLYIVAESNKICCISDEDVLELEEYETESAFEWYCETGNFGYSYPNNKYLSRLQVRLQIADGARASIYVQYNSDGIWHRKGEMNGKGIRTHLIPIVPIRCDHLKIKIAGTGDVKIYSIAKIFEEGGDV